MSSTGHVVIKRTFLFCAAALVILSLSGSFLLVPRAQETPYGSLAVLLNHVKSAKYSYSDDKGNAGEIGYRVLGEYTVSGEAAWKVEWALGESGESPETMNLWISKSTSKCLQVEVEGETYTGQHAEPFGNLMLYAWFAWVGSWTEAWNFTEVYHWEEIGYGHLSFLGSEFQSFGPSQLLVYKYRWEGYTNAPKGCRGVAEFWFAPVSFGTLIVRLYFEEENKWWNLELLSIELASPQPQPNVVVEARIDKTQLKPDEEATISITVSNAGDALGAHNLTLRVDGEVKESWLVVLKPGESKTLSYALSFDLEGSYPVRIGDETFTLTVSSIPPARFEVGNLNISPSSIKVGQSATIQVSVKNTGGESGSYEVILKVNGEAVGRKTVTLDPNQSADVSFSFSPKSEGTYAIDVDGLAESIVVSKPEEGGPGEALGGLPWFVFAAVPVLIVVVVLAVLFSRRKPKPESGMPPPPPPIA